MATVANTNVPFGAVATLRVVNAFVSVKESVTEWNEARITRKALSNLSDDMLSDIGLNRSEIANF
ncbi:DUF1127 domain-containing protein [Tropicibacter sp. Alg240-R139]|uniref:DUF1127 domain-containing protein n=1 Tax=Tropicibacter sp. Alg240-R139 TaxID=2305991 RepID=UPI0013DF5AAC|nr:DUF1127 domain-containing protein [Tropicibacter sp. Alg240-R139]